MCLLPKPRVGQIWSDISGTECTIIADTGHAKFPIVTQNKSGSVFAHGPNGEYAACSEYDLVTLAKDVEDESSEMEA